MKILERNSLRHRDSLHKNGALLIENMISPQENSQLRNLIDSMQYTNRTLHAPEIFDEPEFFKKIFLNPKIIKTLKSLFGEDVTLFPSYQLQINSFTQDNLCKISSGLHVDASEEIANQKRYMTSKTPAWANIGCYLQDHHNDEWGGGIAIVPGSQNIIRRLLQVPIIGGKLAKITVALFRRYYPDKHLCIVPTQSGDALIFDSRLLHTSISGAKSALLKQRGTGKYQTHIEEIPAKNRKYVFYWFASPESLSRDIFKNNFESRAETLTDDFYEGGFNYRKIVSLTYPESYPNWLCELISKSNIKVAAKKNENPSRN